jgi:hypothetical protein
MLDWFRRIVRPAQDEQRQRFFEKIDGLSAEVDGGKARSSTKVLGNLKLRSGALTIGDPQYLDLVVPDIAADEVSFSASLWRYPSGHEKVAALTLGLAEASTDVSCRTIGEVPIDSATMLVADKLDLEEHWAEIGKDRIGVITTAPDDTVLRMLVKRFGLKTIQVTPWRTEVEGSVSKQLEQEIEDFLKADPQYREFPFIYFHVQTNGSFDRALEMEAPWGFIPIGNRPLPLMFVCGTGHGDGTYDVIGEFTGDILRALKITFIETEDSA